jgi:hypothetical protein
MATLKCTRVGALYLVPGTGKIQMINDSKR